MSEPYFLFTGAAGYVGSHVLRLFLEREKPCLVVDNLSTGHRDAVPPAVPFFQGGIQDSKLLSEIFRSYPVRGILHFAGFIEVGESVKNPGKYFENNLAHGLPLLEISRTFRIPWILFSSTAAVYGEPERVPIHESALKTPNNPYGLTKWAFEQMLAAYGDAYGIRSISLRYFNAAGAHPSAELGEDHDPESHLIPRACKAVLGQLESLEVYGADYPTPDGTCIRDYLHIQDLAETHLLAAQALDHGHVSDAYNVGSEKGYSVRQVIETLRLVSGKEISVCYSPRRAGDSAILVASSEKYRKEFSWSPKFQSLEKIVESAWTWHQARPGGFKKQTPNVQRVRTSP